MRIIEMRALRGPNYYSQRPVMLLHLDIGELEDRPTDLVHGFKENLEKILPSLYEHTCSPGVQGGFFQRIVRGTWAGHVVEHIALELQNLIGHNVTYGKAITLDERGHYQLIFRYLNEDVALRAGEMAVEIAENLFNGELTDVESMVEELKDIEEDSLFGPSTQSIVDEAKSRGIPHIRLNEHSYVQLGQGKYQRKFQATIMDSTSHLGVEIAGDKERTKEILGANGIPVPQGQAVKNYEDALRVVSRIKYPVVVKPVSGNHGRGISTNITKDEELKTAIELAQNISNTVVIEKYIKGFDFRLMVINGKFVAAALREPAYVIGNGEDDIEHLINKLNEDPKRGDGHEKVLTKVKIDEETKRVLELEGLTLQSIPAVDEKVYVKSTANLSTGGTSANVTQSVHPYNILMAERISRLIGLDVIGIDLLAETLEEPVEIGKAGVVEVNAAPGFRMHLHPSSGEPINVAKPIVDMMFPEGAKHSVPICAVTGTNGKTTTTRLISHILSHYGCTVGMTSTDAVVVDNVPILKGDYSGPGGVLALMKDSTVEIAVLEVARGGIIRRGLGFDECDVGVLLNVTSDHLGLNGIDTLEQLARLKSTVTETVKKDGYAVFNADDPLVLSRVEKTKGTPILFSMDMNNPALLENLQKGNTNVTVQGENVILQKPGGNSDIAKIVEIPITFEGYATFNIENVLAAVGAAHGLGVSEDQIKNGLISFSPSIGQSPGRMNIIDIGDFKVLIDYGHNVGAMHATGEFVRNLMPGRKIRMAAGVGDRRTEDLLEYGEAIAKYNDYIVLCDPSPRRRKPGQTAEIVKEGLMRGGMKEDHIKIIISEPEATQEALNMAGPGDLVILQVEDIARVTRDVLEYKKKFLEEQQKG